MANHVKTSIQNYFEKVLYENLTNKPITNTAWVRPRLCKKYKKGCTRLVAASDKVYQLLPHGRWFSPGTPASSITKTGRHDIAEILLKAGVKHNKSIIIFTYLQLLSNFQQNLQVSKSSSMLFYT
jgi:hypothetical protein